MAVLPFLPGLTVEIIVNDAPLSEYDDDSDTPASPTTITKYAEATSGANFAIKVTLTEKFPFPVGVLGGMICLDGEFVVASFRDKGDFFGSSSIEGVPIQIGQYPKIQKFCFDELIAVEERMMPAGEGLVTDPESMGVISIAFCYFKNIRQCPRNDTLQSSSVPLRVSEQTLKGKLHTHRAGLSEPVAAMEGPTWICDPITDTPFATFNFKYRSIDALRTLGLVPREPTPPPLEERPEDELTPEELRELVKQLKEQKAAAVKVKKEAVNKRKRVDEAVEPSDGDEVTVVRSRDRKRHRGADQEVIVLD